MVDMDNALLERLRAESALADYVHILDSDRLEEWPDLFTDNGVYCVITRENVELGLPLPVMSCRGRDMMRDRISALRTANVFEPHVYCHVPGALRVVDSGAGEIKTESTFLVLRTMAEGATSIFACGRTIDRFVEHGPSLKLAERTVVLDSRQVNTLMVIPL
jgi:anthranilate 1,2-dioxygenase small subunit